MTGLSSPLFAAALALCIAASGCEPAEDDLHGDWFGETPCRQGISLETSLWFEVLTRDTWRGELTLVWRDAFEDEPWQFALHADFDARLLGDGGVRDLELLPEPDSCEASPFADWPCPERFNLEWRRDEQRIDGVFFFGEPTVGADGEPASVWHRCDPILRH